VILGNEKINEGDTFTYLGSIISKDDGCSEEKDLEVYDDTSTNQGSNIGSYGDDIGQVQF